MSWGGRGELCRGEGTKDTGAAGAKCLWVGHKENVKDLRGVGEAA